MAMPMPKLSIMLTMVFFLLFMIIFNQPSSARTLGVPSLNHPHQQQQQQQHHHHHHPAHSSHSMPTMSFLMRDVLNSSVLSYRPTTEFVSNQLPFSKPVGFFPPNGGIPLTQPNPTRPTDGYSTQTLDLSSIGLSFPARATLQELDFGNVIVIDEDIFEEQSSAGSSSLEVFGKAQGIYVSSSEGGHSHMMATTVVFSNNEFKDSLRFFGVKMIDDNESHVAIIGGIGKYHNANGYATIKGVNYQNGKAVTKLLLFKVYLSVEV